MNRIIIWAAVAVLACSVTIEAVEQHPGTVASLVRSVSDLELQRLINEVLARNPEVAAASARARAVVQTAPRVRSLPDPTVGLT